MDRRELAARATVSPPAADTPTVATGAGFGIGSGSGRFGIRCAGRWPGNLPAGVQ